MDEERVSSKVRRRGVPSSHLLSDVLGETVLFCLDLAVDQVGFGQPLWRYGHDLWFRSPNYNKAISAWKAVENFTQATGTLIITQHYTFTQGEAQHNVIDFHSAYNREKDTGLDKTTAMGKILVTFNPDIFNNPHNPQAKYEVWAGRIVQNGWVTIDDSEIHRPITYDSWFCADLTDLSKCQ
jgi:hypothetical protein